MGSTQEIPITNVWIGILGYFFFCKGDVEVIDKKTNHLYDLASALLIGEGEFDFSDDSKLSVPFDRKKSMYLSEVIKNERLSDYININPKRGQIYLHSHEVLETIKYQWYKDGKKIFSFILDPNLLTLKSIIMCINLFGERKLETISIPTNIEREHIKTLAYCIEKHLNVPVIPGANQVKITNIPTFVIECVYDLPAIHSTELINFLTEKEKKKIMGGAKT